jgi:hypothetical protein
VDADLVLSDPQTDPRGGVEAGQAAVEFAK